MPHLSLAAANNIKRPPAFATVRVVVAEMCTYSIWRLADVEPVSPTSILGWISMWWFCCAGRKEVLQVLLCWCAARLVLAATLWLRASSVCTLHSVWVAYVEF